MTNLRELLRGLGWGLLFFALLYMATADACTAFFRYERISGLNKLCFYDHLSSGVAITIKNYELCPVTIEVEH